MLTGLRLLLIPILWWAAFSGQGMVVAVGMLAAGATDYLDGRLARGLNVASLRGAHLDALADTLLLVSAAVWLARLHPEIAADNGMLIGATCVLYAAPLFVCVVRFGHLPRSHPVSSKVAGGCLYAFAVVTLATGSYEPLLLMLAAGSLMVSSIETLVGLSLRAREDHVEG